MNEKFAKNERLDIFNVPHSLSIDTGNKTEDSSEKLINVNGIIQNQENNNLNSQNINQRYQEISSKNSKHRFILLYVFDIILSIFIFSPIVAFYWYGTWLMIDLYFFSKNIHSSNILSYLVGLLVLFILYIFVEQLSKLYSYLKIRNTKMGRLLMLFIRVTYVYVMSLAIVFQWRGLWNLFDLYFYTDAEKQISLSIVAITYFCLTRSTRTLIVTPFVLCVDDAENFFDQEESRFKLKSVIKCNSYQ